MYISGVSYTLCHMNPVSLKYILVGSFCLFSSMASLAQKKVLDHSVYDSWKSLKSVKISDDASYSAVVIVEQEGDDRIEIHHLKGGKTHTIPGGSTCSFMPDQKYIVGLVKASYVDIRQAKIKKTASEKMPKDTLVIVSLKSFSETRIPNVKEYKFGKDYSDYIAYLLSDTLKAPEKGTVKCETLIVRNIYTGLEDTIKHVTEYQFSRNGKTLGVIIQPSEKDTLAQTQVLCLDMSKYSKKVISEGKNSYKNMCLSEEGDKVAFLTTTDSMKKEIKAYDLYYFEKGLDAAKLVVDKSMNFMPKNWFISEHYNIHFSRNGKRLLFGTMPIPAEKDTTIPDFEKAQLDIWNWKDLEIQPKQLVDLDKEIKRSYLAYVDLNDRSFSAYQLGTEEIPDVTILDEENGSYAIGYSRLNYLLEGQWDYVARSSMYDLWLFDLVNHSKKQIKNRLKASLSYSSKGESMVWYSYDDAQYYVYHFATGEERCLTDKLEGINFWDELNDTPSPAQPYGVAYWYENDEAIVVYDKYDLWKLDIAGKNEPKNLSNHRKNEITLRYVNTDPEKRFVTSKEKLLLSGFNHVSKEGGYYELSQSSLRRLVMDKYMFLSIEKAKNADVFVYEKSNYNTSPDLYVTTNRWKGSKKLTDINPQMHDYNWCTVELMEWTTFDGQKTQGLVYKPEDFDPNKKYPVITYFYERQTDLMYRYSAPAPSRSIINISYFCSNGYIVFIPDIKYTVGYPGKSAYDYVVSGVKELCKNQWVDADNVGVQGQSWGGYQIAYLVTCTDVFKAAWAGAPVSNMFSAYGGIRWATGFSRQYQYEQTQSRIGKTIWEAPELYKENSPIFYADKVNTPLVIMHNDNDGAVPWYQGIEYFMALRRLGKPVWLLQYNKEAHNLVERRNSKDLSIRLQQYFDHYLKGKAAPVWIETGVPAVQKGYTYGLEEASESKNK